MSSQLRPTNTTRRAGPHWMVKMFRSKKLSDKEQICQSDMNEILEVDPGFRTSGRGR